VSVRVRHNWFYSARVFLMALGLGERLAALSNSGEEIAGTRSFTHLLRREALHQLIDPLGWAALVSGSEQRTDRSANCTTSERTKFATRLS